MFTLVTACCLACENDYAHHVEKLMQRNHHQQKHGYSEGRSCGSHRWRGEKNPKRKVLQSSQQSQIQYKERKTTQVIVVGDCLTHAPMHNWKAFAITRLKWCVKSPIKAIFTTQWSPSQDDPRGGIANLKCSSSDGWNSNSASCGVMAIVVAVAKKMYI